MPSEMPCKAGLDGAKTCKTGLARLAPIAFNCRETIGPHHVLFAQKLRHFKSILS